MYPRHMSSNGHPIDALIAELAPVRDDELVGEVRSSAAAALLVSVLELPVRARGRRRGGPHRSRVVALVAAVGVAAVLSIPAFGVGEEIVSLFAGGRDPGAPVPTASDVLIASGEAGVPWKIVATRSDQGLCLGLFHRAGDDLLGSAGCGYTGIRGDLPPDVRGDPATRCIGPPTALAPGGTLVPCGSLPQRWIGLGGAGISVGLEHRFAFGPLAEEVTRVDLILTDGRTVRAHVVEQPEGLPLNFYWAAWPCPLQPVLDGPYAGEGLQECTEAGPVVKVAIARDAAGRVLERRVPAWNGNPTGDPDGPPPPAPLGE
jgi:hypothetical protein